MDFLEAFIIKNERISDDLKVSLFDRQEMIVYDFVGELMCLENQEGSVTENARFKEKYAIFSIHQYLSLFTLVLPLGIFFFQFGLKF